MVMGRGELILQVSALWFLGHKRLCVHISKPDLTCPAFQQGGEV